MDNYLHCNSNAFQTIFSINHVAIYIYCMLCCKGYGSTNVIKQNDHRQHAGTNMQENDEHTTTYFESRIPIPREGDRDVS